MTFTPPTETRAEPAYAPDDRAERVFVDALWLAMTIALAAFLALYARDQPYQEDWEIVQVLTGNRPFSLSWLLEPMIEHRYILQRALLYPIWLATGDFRGLLWVDGLLLSALALACTRVARAVRGRAAFADAFFPVALLHWAHSETLLFFSQIYYVLPIVLFSAAMLLIASGRWQSRAGTATLGLSILLLPLNGAMGMLYAPPLVAWAAYAALARRRDAWVLLAAAAVAVVIAGLYFVGYGKPPMPTLVERTALGTARTMLEVLGVSLGAGGTSIWPVVGVGVAALFAATGCLLAYVAVTRPAERVRAAGLLACLASSALVTAGIGYGRTVLGPGGGLPGRYSLLVAPGLCCVCFAGALYGGKVAGHLVQAVLFTCACVLLSPNVKSGLDYARYRSGTADDLVADVRAGASPEAIAQRFWPRIFPNPEALAERLEMLRERRLGPYRDAPPQVTEGPLREVPVAVSVVETNQVQLENGVARGLGVDPFVVYALPATTDVRGIRLDYTVTNGGGTPPWMQVFWRRDGPDPFVEQRSAWFQVAPGPQSATVWIYGEIDQFRIDPDTKPCEFQLAGVTLLVAE